MLKRNRSTVVSERDDSRSLVLKRHRPSVVELLPHHVLELILERLPVKLCLRFKSVSKNWKSTIESQRFREQQFIRRRQSRGLDVLFVSFGVDYHGDVEALRMRIILGSSIVCTVRFPNFGSTVCHASSDGVLCLNNFEFADTPNFLVNPATRWYQSFPRSSVQQLMFERIMIKRMFDTPCPKLGFGKDKVRGTFKPVWLYNSSEFGLDNATTCEVFDFGTNAWRYILPASPYRIISFHYPEYLDGSLYWFTECEETKILSLDLHTETFHVISKTPFPRVRDPSDFTMCILDNRLCVSEKKWPTQVIWSFDSSGGNQPWKKLCSIDLTKTFTWLGEPEALFPIAIVDKTKLLLHGRSHLHPIVIHDLHTKSIDVLYTPTTNGDCVFYSPSLFSV